jgi:hypothetical protein
MAADPRQVADQLAAGCAGADGQADTEGIQGAAGGEGQCQARDRDEYAGAGNRGDHEQAEVAVLAEPDDLIAEDEHER